MHEQARSSKINHRAVASSCVKSTKCLKNVFGDTQHPSLFLRKNYNPHKWQIHEQVWQVFGWSSPCFVHESSTIPSHPTETFTAQSSCTRCWVSQLRWCFFQASGKRGRSILNDVGNCTCQTEQVPKYKHLLEHTTKMVNDLKIFHHLLGVIVWSCGTIYEFMNGRIVHNGAKLRTTWIKPSTVETCFKYLDIKVCTLPNSACEMCLKFWHHWRCCRLEITRHAFSCVNLLSNSPLRDSTPGALAAPGKTCHTTSQKADWMIIDISLFGQANEFVEMHLLHMYAYTCMMALVVQTVSMTYYCFKIVAILCWCV